MPRSHTTSNEQILDALRAAGEPVTAESLGLVGVNAARLKTIEGVALAGSVKTGKPGRPALLFSIA